MQLFRAITTLLLAVLFAVATTGISVVQHYCADRLDSVTLFAGDKACGCKSAQPKSCCKDEIALHKLDTQYQVQASQPSLQQIAAVLLPVVVYAHTAICTTDPVLKPLDTSPPRPADILLTTRVLLI